METTALTARVIKSIYHYLLALHELLPRFLEIFQTSAMLLLSSFISPFSGKDRNLRNVINKRTQREIVANKHIFNVFHFSTFPEPATIWSGLANDAKLTFMIMQS